MNARLFRAKTLISAIIDRRGRNIEFSESSTSTKSKADYPNESVH